VRFGLDSPPFGGRTGVGVTVAVLDSGIHGDHPHVGGVQGGVVLVDDCPSDDLLDRVGHGTAVAAAIREKSPAVALLAVKVFHTRLATNVDVLARAIEWSAENGATLINLSLGTANPTHTQRLVQAVEHATLRGAIVVSAREANAVAWLPGSLPGVVGVVADATMSRDEIDVTQASDGRVIVTASPYPRPIPNVPKDRNLSGVSFAVANATGFLARAAEAGRLNDVIPTLSEGEQRGG
jgi:subtilisin family serine protease